MGNKNLESGLHFEASSVQTNKNKKEQKKVIKIPVREERESVWARDLRIDEERTKALEVKKHIRIKRIKTRIFGVFQTLAMIALLYGGATLWAGGYYWEKLIGAFLIIIFFYYQMMPFFTEEVI